MIVAKQIVGGLRDRVFASYERRRLTNKAIVMVSNNCWGYQLYDSLDCEYTTPFVGLYVRPEFYVEMLRDFPRRLNIRDFHYSAESSGEVRHPVGVLQGGEEIEFLHYQTPEDALAKWNRRLGRMKRLLERSDSILAVKMCDRSGCKPQHLSAFHHLPFPLKVSLGIHEHDSSSHIAIPHLKDTEADSVIDGLRLYRKRYKYFDIAEWLTTGKVSHTPFSRVMTRVC